MISGKNIPGASPVRELLARKESGSGPHPPRPLDHLAFAILTDIGAAPAVALAALDRLRREFVDWNEARVARSQEIVRTLGREIAGVEQAAIRIKEEYNAFFDKRGALGFDFLASGKPGETRWSLRQLLPHLGKGAILLLLYEFSVGASLPISDAAIKQAKKDGIAGKNTDRNQLARVLADNMHPAEACLLVQYWELEASGHPYGEAGKRGGGQAAKKEKKPAGKAKKGKK
ncbi:MAG: hypothetical protein FWG74_09370 [Planctomycetes bacterium]|nr:hypothetical protein [Planctomycetota bacterium]